jgi:transglutaminase-like putative cysteine protease
VRAGDLLEEAYTVESAHPLFQGHHMDAITLASEAPVAHLVHRLLAPAGLVLHFKTHGTQEARPTERDLGGLREYRWERKDVPAFAPEQGIPSDLAEWPHVQVSSFQSWAEVASWGRALMEGMPESPEVKARAESWRSLPTEEARFLAAVRFVQDEVRYLGLEIGPNTHQPHPPEQVLAQRFGDCKDKALLLATLLRTLGIPAHVALVSAHRQGGVAHLLPSAWAFDHAIVRAQVAGRTEWVDATQTHRRGRLGTRGSLPYGKALVLAPGTTDLEPIPQPALEGPETDVRYVLSVKDDGTGTFAVTSRHVRSEADNLRSLLAGLSAEQLSTRQFEQYHRLFSKLKPEGPPRVVDDEDSNTVTLEVKYTLEDAWADGGLKVAAPQVAGQLALPRHTEGRSFPLEVDHPTHLRVRWEVRSDSILNVAPEQHTVEGPASRLDMTVTSDFNGFVYQVEYRSLADRVAPEAMARHAEAVGKMGPLLGLSFAAPIGTIVSSNVSTSDSFLLSRNVSLALSGVFLLVLATFGLGLPRRLREFVQKRRARRARRPAPRPVLYLREREQREKEQAAPPILIDNLEQADQHIRQERCSCGGTFERVPDAQQLRHTGSDGRTLTVLRLRCTSCHAPQFLTFDVRPN